ncbi:MAG: hypothetical protein WBO10_02130 [Pyrinomonadaceae bacterium]
MPELQNWLNSGATTRDSNPTDASRVLNISRPGYIRRAIPDQRSHRIHPSKSG